MKTLLLSTVAFSFASVVLASETITEVRVKELAPRHYFCAKKEVTIAEIGEFATTTIPQLMARATELKLGQTGPIMITYFSFRGDPEQKFTAEIGIPIHSEKAATDGGFYIRKTEKSKCAAAIFQGPVSQKGEAWQSFVQSAMAKGEPANDSRELYLYWEGPDSANNIIELQMGLK